MPQRPPSTLGVPLVQPSPNHCPVEGKLQMGMCLELCQKVHGFKIFGAL